MSVSASTVSEPLFRIPPPEVDEPPLIVKSVSVAVTSTIDLEYFDLIATADRQRRCPGRRSPFRPRSYRIKPSCPKLV